MNTETPLFQGPDPVELFLTALRTTFYTFMAMPGVTVMEGLQVLTSLGSEFAQDLIKTNPQTFKELCSHTCKNCNGAYAAFWAAAGQLEAADEGKCEVPS